MGGMRIYARECECDYDGIPKRMGKPYPFLSEIDGEYVRDAHPQIKLGTVKKSECRLVKYKQRSEIEGEGTDCQLNWLRDVCKNCERRE